MSCRRRERKIPEKRSVPGVVGPAKGAAAELLPRPVNRFTAMANSMSNIKMTNPIKNMVSKRRIRYTKHGFNLDLAYITDRLIAMGFPAEKLEGVYRNHIDEVYRFLETMHKDHYKIYNLCSERTYDPSKFHKRVERYAFEDHTPPHMELIQPFCENVHSWLSADTRNVAVVHCKAGKGRTGTMVCCYLLYSGDQPNADEALKFYGRKRTLDEKGVTIPSQRRYVEYYGALLRSGVAYRAGAARVQVRELRMSPPPAAHVPAAAAPPDLVLCQADPHADPHSEHNVLVLKTPPGCVDVQRDENSIRICLTQCTPLFGDIRVDVYNKPKMKMRKEKLFHFWFNTFFVTAEVGAQRIPPLPDSPDLETYKLTLNKWQLDDAHKDKQHKHYSPDFKVELIVEKVPDSSTYRPACDRTRSPTSSSSSSGSVGSDPETDGNWDSGTVCERVGHYRQLSPDHT